ncbi:MAG: superoxide dismutase [Bacteroidetes bacterium]|nr:superoxide dismutase [Bacteroidota bacterium]MBU1578850.1 superoxide dismutase [Bacteroidota bacterium]MBU2558302.1 superoxide dismutase [Bacteroidota bacterium]
MNTKVKDLKFPELGYAFSALEPHIDAMTMEIHYTKHHKAYFDNLQAAVKDTEMADMAFGELLKNISKFPVGVRNNGGGHFNHSLFWKIMSAQGGGLPQGELAAAIDKSFGSLEAMKEKFNTAAKTRFGSGWAWLCVNTDKSLEICSTPNQDNPLMDVSDCKASPILGLDVWEHAYYLKYQNKRPDYINAFWNVVDWREVAKNYKAAL